MDWDKCVWFLQAMSTQIAVLLAVLVPAALALPSCSPGVVNLPGNKIVLALVGGALRFNTRDAVHAHLDMSCFPNVRGDGLHKTRIRVK